MKKNLAIGLLALFTLLWASPAEARTSIGIDPGKFEYALDPGDRVTGKIRVTNEGDEPIDHVSLYVANIGITQKGKADYVKPTGYEDQRRSPASWILLAAPDPTKIKDNTPYLSLKKGGAVDVKFSIKIPKGVRAGDHTIVVFFEVKQAASKGTTIGGRIGSKIKIRVPGKIVEKLKVERVDFPRVVLGDAADYMITLSNPGNVDLKPKLSVALLEGGRSVSEQALKESYLYVGARVEVKGTYKFSNVPALRKVNITAAYGEKAENRTVTILVIPWWTLGGVGFLTMLAASFMTGRRRGRMAVDKTGAAGSRKAKRGRDEQKKAGRPERKAKEKEKEKDPVNDGAEEEVMPEIARYREQSAISKQQSAEALDHTPQTTDHR